MQWLALSLVAAGILYLVIAHGKIPYIALVLSMSFAIYGVLKKTIQVPAVLGMGVETGLLMLPALLYLLYLHGQSTLSFGQDLTVDVFLILGGIVTLTPLLLFAVEFNRSWNDPIYWANATVVDRRLSIQRAI